MSLMDLTENIRKFACLLAELNKEGLDTKLIELGQGLIPKLGDDEILSLEDDLLKVKTLFKNYQEENPACHKEHQIQLKEKPVVKAYVDGCYDLIHAGHYNAFRQSRKLADVLVCGVNSDLEVSSVKGPTVFNNEERCAIVGACKWVDEVAPDTEYTPTVETLNRYNCDFYVHGDDVALNSDGIDSSHELKAVGRFKMFKRTRGVSTTDIASKLLTIDAKMRDRKELEIVEEEKTNLEPINFCNQPNLPSVLGSFNANPNFLASAKRIANFASVKEPLESDKIVYVDGSWDICHPGHIELLIKAKELGDYLIVGIHEDQCVNQYLGNSYPLNTLHERVLNILA
eukprot:CAMPEP_0196998110 /NCGR_PEP_ID=MMETSP1380-20130617/3571_1 /TAXON_ID=5936 /ORGANISM="Euplotes crassus, Strain CT5" /LENGTH=342 /DNA_ID=CAMNT_0042414559 /DNA_START=14 /DNA_END=1042 /DNA_ORIENTATION=+